MPSRTALVTGQERMLGGFTAGERIAQSVRIRMLACGASVIDAQLRAVGGRLRRLGETN